MNGEIDKEMGIHGGRWESLHGGYFSDPAVAARIIEEIVDLVQGEKPTVLIDLGGGTGCLLSMLLDRHPAPGPRLVNLDLSARQLSRTKNPGIKILQASLAGFTRDLVASRDDRLLCIMRSVLHYSGRDGLLPTLRHLRAQMQAGEYFVHQSACFSTRTGADRVNAIYAGIGSMKWYPTEEELISRIGEAGWEIMSIAAAPPLHFDSGEFKERYRLSDATVATIRSLLMRDFGEEDVCTLEDNGFAAFLPYSIFRCRAGR